MNSYSKSLYPLPSVKEKDKMKEFLKTKYVEKRFMKQEEDNEDSKSSDSSDENNEKWGKARYKKKKKSAKQQVEEVEEQPVVEIQKEVKKPSAPQPIPSLKA